LIERRFDTATRVFAAPSFLPFFNAFFAMGNPPSRLGCVTAHLCSCTPAAKPWPCPFENGVENKLVSLDPGGGCEVRSLPKGKTARGWGKISPRGLRMSRGRGSVLAKTEQLLLPWVGKSCRGGPVFSSFLRREWLTPSDSAATANKKGHPWEGGPSIR